jgi:hypothetical protein
MTDMTIANTIRNQLGGRRFDLMTGAKDYVGGERFLQFKVGRKVIKVTLTDWDLYTFQVFSSKGTLQSTVDMVYADRLRSVFTEATGLHTSI